MRRTGPSKSKRPAPVSPRIRPARRQAKALGPRELRALTKSDLVELVMELQARLAEAVPAEPVSQEATPPGAVPAEPAPTETNPPEAAPADSVEAMPAEPMVAAAVEAAPPAAESVEPTPAIPAPKRPLSLVIDGSVRSGQMVEFPEGDVTVIGSVGSGAEITAGGSIHVYGTLRGRAIAGMSGDRNARIFCHDLQAELLSIDGNYRVAENFDPKLRGRAVQAHLDGMKMVLTPMNGDQGRDAAESWGLAKGMRTRAARVKTLIGIGATRDASLTDGALR